MSDQIDAQRYQYSNADTGHHHAYLLPAVQECLASLHPAESQRHIFDLGCGNGAVAAWLHSKGYIVTGVDPSIEGIREGRRTYPYLKLARGVRL